MCVNLNLTFKMQRKRVTSANHVHSTIPAAHDFWSKNFGGLSKPWPWTVDRGLVNRGFFPWTWTLMGKHCPRFTNWGVPPGGQLSNDSYRPCVARHGGGGGGKQSRRRRKDLSLLFYFQASLFSAIFTVPFTGFMFGKLETHIFMKAFTTHITSVSVAGQVKQGHCFR